ncbi:MAG: hypothetical protein GY765_18220 [bacterium]|nr:hypothetical protein [bacterium]
MKWRKLNNVIHRDLGYFFFGLTLIYAISGLAVNHLREWDSNFSVENKIIKLENVSADTSVDRAFVDGVLEKFGERENYKIHFREAPEKLQIFVLSGTIDVDMENGFAQMEVKKRRPFLRELNYLHLNQAGKGWTWVADIYAVGLFLLALTGLFVLKGKNGFAGRGKWLVIAGVALPIVFLVLYFY